MMYMQNLPHDTMHRLLAKSLYRGYSGKRPNPQEASVLATNSVRWFYELLLRLSIQGCIDEVDPVATPAAFDAARGPGSRAPGSPYSRDEALWYALCEGRLVLRIEGSEVSASVVQRTPDRVTH
jgi:hypothetical protein